MYKYGTIYNTILKKDRNTNKNFNNKSCLNRQDLIEKSYGEK